MKYENLRILVAISVILGVLSFITLYGLSGLAYIVIDIDLMDSIGFAIYRQIHLPLIQLSIIIEAIICLVFLTIIPALYLRKENKKRNVK